MQTVDERIDAVKKRAYELKQKQKVRRNWIITLSSMTACIAIIFGIGNVMPSFMKQISSDIFVLAGNAGSIFSSGNANGYVIIGIIAFCLGICVTIFCVQLHKSSKEDSHDDRDN